MVLRTTFIILVFVTEAWSLTCLQCKGISQPRHCKTVDRCYSGEVCGVERVRNTFGELVYNVGCMAESTCQNVSSKPQVTDECTECCRHDLCNAQGCGEPGYPQNRGPVCYSCPVQSDPDKCHNIAFCKPGEVCKHIVLREFGDTVYVSECSSLHECRQGNQQGVAIVGRDLTHGRGQDDIPVVRGSLTEHVCSGCCIKDLCNEGCNDTTQTADHCASNPCYHGRCESTSNGFKCVCDNDFTGATCDTRIRMCDTIQCVHGKCYENPEGFVCVCTTGYEGLYCENKTDYCRSNPCVHGTCISNKSNYTCTCTNEFIGSNCEAAVATDCYDIYSKNVSQKSGVHYVTLWKSKQTIQVYCDMDTFPYGWTVFQKRFNGSVDFYRNFSEYTNGFGNTYGEFWLGLRYIEEMTSQYESDLRLDLTAADNSHVYEQFENFSLSAYPAYTLRLGRQTVEQISDNPNGFYSLKDTDFSTFDHDAEHDSRNCAEVQRGGWWYRDCAQANLNGPYISPPGTESSFDHGWGGFIYYAWKGLSTLKSSTVMFRKHSA